MQKGVRLCVFKITVVSKFAGFLSIFLIFSITIFLFIEKLNQNLRKNCRVETGYRIFGAKFLRLDNNIFEN